MGKDFSRCKKEFNVQMESSNTTCSHVATVKVAKDRKPSLMSVAAERNKYRGPQRKATINFS